MDQKRLRRVAHPGTLDLGVDDDAQRLFQVGCSVDVDMTVPGAVDDGGHRGIRLHRGDEPGPASRDEQVHPVGRLHQRLGPIPAGVLEKLDPVGGEAGGGERFADCPGDRHVGTEGVRRATQDDGVAGHDAETGSVRGHVGTGLVDHGDDTERDPNSMESHPVVERPASGLSSHRVGQRRDTAQTVGHGRYPPLIETQPIDESTGDPLITRLCHVLSIRLEHRIGSPFHASGHAEQGLTSRLPGRLAQNM